MRKIVAVCVCTLLALAAHHADAKGGNKESAAENAVTASLQNISASYDQQAKRVQSTEKEEAKCDQGKYGSNTDLCAQWKAADAASDSAWWAWAGGILGIVSLAGVFCAIGLAYQANRIASKTARQQLRAYVSLSEFSPDYVRDAERQLSEVRVNAIWKNSGQTPATDFTGDLDWTIIDGPLPDDFDFPPSEGESAGWFVIGPDTKISTSADHHISREEWDRVAAKTARIFIWGWGEYADVFDDERRTEIATELVIDPLPNGNHHVRFQTLGRHNSVDGQCMRCPNGQKPPIHERLRAAWRAFRA